MVCYALSRCRICSRKHKLPIYGSQESQHVFIEKIHLQLIVLNTVCMDCIGKLERLVKDSDFTAMAKTSAFQEESKEEYRAHAINETSEKYTESVSVFPKMHFYRESEEKTAQMESLLSPVHNNTVEKENNSVDDEKLMVGRKQRRCIIANSLEKSLPDTKENGAKKRRLARVKEIRTCKMCCDYCEKEFTHRGDLKRHKRKHTGERPYECTECDKKFSQLSNLSRHRFVHSGERPFICQQCGQSYTRKGRLIHHIKRDLCKRKARMSAARS